MPCLRIRPVNILRISNSLTERLQVQTQQKETTRNIHHCVWLIKQQNKNNKNLTSGYPVELNL